MPRLTIRRGPEVGKVFELENEVITIGRASHNEIVLNDNDVSRSHCQLRRTNSAYEIKDLDSTNGTFIDGQRVLANRMLRHGQQIELGESITLAYEDNHTPDLPEDSGPIQKITPIEMAKDFALAVEIGPAPRRFYSLEADAITVGRDLSNQIVVQDPEVSRWHLKLIRNPEGGYRIQDLESTNGTMLNGAPVVEERNLAIFDVIELGTAVRLFYIQDSEAARKRMGGESPQRTTDNLKKAKTETQEQQVKFAQPRKTSRLGTGLRSGALLNHIIIAYARSDWEPMVAPLTLALQDAGMKVWVDQYLAQGGDDWQTAIEQALQECELMLLIVSPAALDSSYVRLAYRYFINREKPVLPVLYAPVSPLPAELASLESFSYDAEDQKRSFQRLIHMVLDRRQSG